jgi:hypothetical protein
LYWFLRACSPTISNQLLQLGFCGGVIYRQTL